MNQKMETCGALLLFVMGAAFTIFASRIPEPMLQQDMNTTPAFFPVLVGAIFSLLSLAQFLKTLLNRPSSGGAVETRAKAWVRLKPAFMIMGVLAAYIIMMQVIGWMISSFLMTVSVFLIAATRERRKAGLPLLLLIGLTLTALVFIVFDRLLGVPLPRGVFSPELMLGL